MSKKGVKMSISKRQEQILELLNKNGFMTVKKLSQLTYTSESSIRRDLTKLQNMYFIKRTHGGANISNANQVAPLQNRLSQNTAAKRKIAKKAEHLICDGQIIMLDGSSSAGFLIPYIAKHKDITLFTNNMITALNAINYGIKTHCVGGSSVNNSAVLSGPQSYRVISEIHPDILFFSSYSLDKNGIISDPTEEENYIRSLMLANTKQSVFLCDSEKFNRKSLYTLSSINDIDIAIFDTVWEELNSECKIL